MGSHYSLQQKQTMDRDCRQMAAAGLNLWKEFDAIREDLDATATGFTAEAENIDALCKGAAVFAWDAENTAGLSFSYFSGRYLNGAAVVTVAAGTIVLTQSQTNYVELDPADATVKSNTAAFTAGRIPLYVVITSATEVTTVTNARAVLVSAGLSVGAQTIAGVKTFSDRPIFASGLAIDDGEDVVLGTVTGTKLGTAANQKLGFFGAVPVAQPTAAAQAALVDNSGGAASDTIAAIGAAYNQDEVRNAVASLAAKFNRLRTDLVALGLIKGAA
jgi:hypothetical protein